MFNQYNHERISTFIHTSNGGVDDLGATGEYSCYHDAEDAKEVAMESEWEEHQGKYYCPDCYNYNDEDVFILNLERTIS